MFFFCELKYIGHDVEFFLTVKLQMLREQIENSLRFFKGVFLFLFFWGGRGLSLYLICLSTTYNPVSANSARSCVHPLHPFFFSFLFALLSLPVFVERTCTWRGGNPQPTGPSGPPSSAFCSEIILPPHRLPPPLFPRVSVTAPAVPAWQPVTWLVAGFARLPNCRVPLC